MRDEVGARRALDRASHADNEIDRTVWLASAADHAIKRRAVLVGGSAVNLHTGSYRPTDIDLCAYLDEADRRLLQSVGFEQIQGDHFSYTFEDGERWLVEFPDSQVDGEVMELVLDDGETLAVITLESLIVDRLLQATDGTGVTFDEAVRLCLAASEHARWWWVEADIGQRDQLEPGLELRKTYQRVKARTGALLTG